MIIKFTSIQYLRIILGAVDTLVKFTKTSCVEVVTMLFFFFFFNKYVSFHTFVFSASQCLALLTPEGFATNVLPYNIAFVAVYILTIHLMPFKQVLLHYSSYKLTSLTLFFSQHQQEKQRTTKQQHVMLQRQHKLQFINKIQSKCRYLFVK